MSSSLSSSSSDNDSTAKKHSKKSRSNRQHKKELQEFGAASNTHAEKFDAFATAPTSGGLCFAPDMAVDGKRPVYESSFVGSAAPSAAFAHAGDMTVNDARPVYEPSSFDGAERGFSASSNSKSSKSPAPIVANDVVMTSEPRWRDFLFVVAFYVNLLVYVVVVAVSLSKNDLVNDITTTTNLVPYIPLICLTSLFAMLFAALCNALAFKWPVEFGFGAIIFEMLFIIAYCVYFCVTYRPDTALIVVSLLCLFVLLITLVNFWAFADMAKQLTFAVRTIAMRQKGNFAAVSIGILALSFWTGLWWILTTKIVAKWSAASLYGVLIHSIFTYYWLSETMRNVVHVTVAGSHASYYFAGELNVPVNPTMGAFKRATTYSFGTICLGSMLVSILMTLKRVLQLLRFRARHPILFALSIIARILLFVIEALLRFLNKYVFSIVAISGASYVEATKQLRALFGTDGLDLVMQNNIVTSMIGASTVVGMLAGAGLGALIASTSALNVWVGVSMGMLCAMFIVDGSFVLLESGSMTLLVSFLLAPDVMRDNNPDLFRLFTEAGLKRADAEVSSD